jgi:hypothetical protein
MKCALILAQCGHWWVETAGPGATLDIEPHRECSKCNEPTRVAFVTEWKSESGMMPSSEVWLR